MNTRINEEKQKNIRNLSLILSVGVIGMFGFGYALVPLYSVLCKSLGINGKTNQEAFALSKDPVDKSRTITVQFLATRNNYLPWKFYPVKQTIKIHPGENTKVAFYAENETDKPMTVQAVPSVSPGIVAKYLKKTECFCFTQQTMRAKHGMEWPLIFHIDKEVPNNIHTITLSYTLFLSKKKSPPNIQLGRIPS